MLNESIRPTSLRGIKRLARQVGRSAGLRHSEALKVAANAASFVNFEHARGALTKQDDMGNVGYRLFLTYYWAGQKPFAMGRETLEIWLSKPLLELCNKRQMRSVRALNSMRLAAPDHLVADEVGTSQDFVRREIHLVVRALRFMEATGLQPCDSHRARIARNALDSALPKKDHDSDWFDPSTGQFVLIDEPYTAAILSDERSDWASRNNWHLKASTWPGMYFPKMAAFFVATPADTGFDFRALMEKIDAIPDPVNEYHWDGISAIGHETFVSPLATSPQDKRRAQAKGAIVRLATKKTIPTGRYWGRQERKPNGLMSISDHQHAGRMIKAVLQSRHKPGAVNRRMDSVRSKLEDWLGYEASRNQMNDPAVYDAYYGDSDQSDPYLETASAADGVIELLTALNSMLVSAYPECAPLRAMIRKLDTAIAYTSKGKAVKK